MEVKSTVSLKSSGFSLVEIMIAMVIGSVGLLALSGILTYVMRTNRMATDISISTALARQKIEQLKLTDYNYVLNQTEEHLDANGNVNLNSGLYKRVTVVENNHPAFNTKTVTVTVYFSPNAQDSEKKAAVSTIIYP